MARELAWKRRARVVYVQLFLSAAEVNSLGEAAENVVELVDAALALPLAEPDPAAVRVAMDRVRIAAAKFPDPRRA